MILLTPAPDDCSFLILNVSPSNELESSKCGHVHSSLLNTFPSLSLRVYTFTIPSYFSLKSHIAPDSTASS